MKNWKISTEIASTAKHVGEEKAIELIAKAGFDAWDMSMFSMCRWDWTNNVPAQSDHVFCKGDYLAYARKLKQIGLDSGIHCNQTHAPFPSRPPMYDYLKRAIECSAEVGAEICVIHPWNYHTAEENAEMYGMFLPFAKECGVKIATENMWNWNKETDEAAPAACSDSESFLAHLHAVNDPNFVACLDIGHAEMKGLGEDAPHMIRSLGSYLQALHIHDNDRWHDSHQIPFSMQIDFDAVAKALSDIGYDGYLTLEADAYLNKYTADTVFEGVKELALSARQFAEKINQY